MVCSCTNRENTTHVLISFIPCNGFPVKYLYDTEEELGEFLNRELNIEAHIEYDDEQEEFSKKGRRLKADEVIKHFHNDSMPLTIAFLTEDIEYNGKGIVGLSIHPDNNACVVSTYRLKNKKDLWKAAAHEFIHTYFDYSHCPKDDPHCLMQDAKGHVKFKGKNGLCDYCREKILKGYKLY